jgi:hypothetical protein
MGVECYRCGEAMTPQGGCGCKDAICLVCGDCLEVLPLLEPGSVDVLSPARGAVLAARKTALDSRDAT